MSIKLEAVTLLTEGQKDMLFFIYQREKVARDVYDTLSKIYKDENTFALMKFAEQRHLNCTRELCDLYGVETSMINEDSVGVFESPVLQTLYDECAVKGSHSLMDAFEVGEFLESTDIEDLEQASVGMPSDVVDVYNRLKQRNISYLGVFKTAISKAA
ncbi:MAG TPA: DUF2202 domain-containing protein [Sulfurovum sp.]